MPRLPDVSQLGRRPAPQDRGGIATQNTTAPGLAMAQVGQVIGQIGEEIQKKNDEQAVFEARRKLDQWERDTLYDAEKGVVAKRGADALDLPTKVPQDYDKFAGEVASTLTSNRQRKVFQDMAQSRRNQVADFTIRHATQQKEVYEKGQVSADMIASSERAVLLATNGDPGAARAELDVSGARLMNYMKVRGAPGEEIAMALKANASGTHEAVVRSLVNKGDPLAAKAYFDANSAGMLEKDKLQAGGLLKEGVMRAKAQAFGDEAMSSDMDLKTALETARKRFTGDEEVAATNEIKTRFAEKEAVKAQAVKQVSNEAWSALMAKGSMSAIPPATMQLLRATAPEEERQMRDWLDAKYRQAKSDAEGKDQDPQVYYGLRMMAAENPEQFARLDLMKSQPYMSKQHQNHLVELQAGISKGDLKAMESQRVIKSTLAMVKNEAGAAGIDLALTEKDKGTKKANDSLAFMGSLSQALDEATAAKGKALTPEEAKRIGLGLLREGIVQGSGIFFDDKKRGFELTPEERAKFASVPYDKIPAATRAEIEADLYPNGKPTRGVSVDKARVERIYQRAIDAGRIK